MDSLDKQILEEQKQARAFVEQQGLAINDDNTDYQRDLMRVYDEIYPLFCTQLEQVGFRYLYSWMQSAQKVERFRVCDGYSSFSTNIYTGARASSIGISCAAIARGHDYIVLVLLHELAHLLLPQEEHSEYFHYVLDDLIAQYNARFGSHVRNDYYGLPATTNGQAHEPNGARPPKLVQVLPL